MGNRAAVVFTDKSHKEISPAIYLHWNGGPESIYAFLDELTRRKCRHDVQYAAARFTHIVCDFFDADEAGSTSIGLMPAPTAITEEVLAELAGAADDNGVFIVFPDKSWGLTVRRFTFDYKTETAKEMSKPQVEKERKLAYQHIYHVGDQNNDTISSVFLKMRPTISEYG